jgi:hypothetical protein
VFSSSLFLQVTGITIKHHHTSLTMWVFSNGLFCRHCFSETYFFSIVVNTISYQ